MTRVSTAAQLCLIGLVWLAPSSSAEAATIVDLFSDEDAPCGQPPIVWLDLSGAGIGGIHPLLRLTPESTAECEDTDHDNGEREPALGGGFAGGFGGLLGGFPAGPSSGPIVPASGALTREGEFVIGAPDVFDPPPSFTGDAPPSGGGPIVRHAPSFDGPGGGDNIGTIGIIGSDAVFPLGSSVTANPFPPGANTGSIAVLQEMDDPSLSVVPEPGSFLLLGTGLALVVRRLRRRG